MKPWSFILGLGALGACSSETPAEAPGGGLLDAGLDAEASTTEAGGDAAGDAGSDSAPPFDGPETLADTGLYADIGSKTIAADVIAFGVRYPLWSDGAEKARFFRLPPGEVIDTSNMDFWKFPLGTRAWKEFSLGGKRLETRYLEKRGSGPEGWLEISYVWDAGETNALPMVLGQPNVAGTSHDVPSSQDCTQCHNGAGDVLIGVSAIQLSAGGTLSEWTAAGRFSIAPPTDIDVPGTGNVQDALGYLHAQCGHCHNDVHFLASKRLMRLRLPSAPLSPGQTPTYLTTIGGAMSHSIAGSTIAVVPGAPDQSQLFLRMTKRDFDAMPPLGTKVVDPEGLATISTWISSLQ
ncbi:MAG: hypothetical protein KF718_26065 [Polyangiaceae bacterium]|nr:hypothetical protein [Polyangiaceae bacterium]